MALARTFVAGLIAVALALAPVGSAFARFNGPHGMAAAMAAMHALEQGGDDAGHHHADRSPPHGETAMHMGHARSGPCDHGKTVKSGGAPVNHGDCDCCDKKQNACAEFCLQKCFGQLCVVAPDRLADLSGSGRLPLPATERPPDWIPPPRTPPPRA